jgi:hypothetical protein
MIYLFAGSSREHLEYCRKHKIDRQAVKYIYKLSQLEGLNEPVVLHGTYFLNPQAKQMLEIINNKAKA